jgi:hypothetical protein
MEALGSCQGRVHPAYRVSAVPDLRYSKRPPAILWDFVPGRLLTHGLGQLFWTGPAGAQRWFSRRRLMGPYAER